MACNSSIREKFVDGLEMGVASGWVGYLIGIIALESKGANHA